MISNRVGIGIVLEPSLEIDSGLLNPDFQQIDGAVDLAQMRVDACCVVSAKVVIWINRQCTRQPFQRPLTFAESLHRLLLPEADAANG